MLICFTFENWMSFKEENCFHAIADDNIDPHSADIYHIEDYQANILPSAVIYGGNASGKSNFFKALSFVKDFVINTEPRSEINTVPFRLDVEHAADSSYFSTVLYAGGAMYEFEFIVNRSEVIAESLTKLARESGTVLYNREDHQISFDQVVPQQELLNQVFKGTRPNQLFLQACALAQADAFREVFDWFLHSLEIVCPDDLLRQVEPSFFRQDNQDHGKITEMLSKLDTGFDDLRTVKCPWADLSTHLPPALYDKRTLQAVQEGCYYLACNPLTREKYILGREHGELVLRKLCALHQTQQGRKFLQHFSLEPAGISRLIDLLPVILNYTDPLKHKVYFIDEFDRSLHPKLLRALIKFFQYCTDNSPGSQLFFSCSDVSLLQELWLRRDQFWLVEKNLKNESMLEHFTSFKEASTDKYLMYSYLNGSLGGVPNVNSILTVLQKQNMA